VRIRSAISRRRSPRRMSSSCLRESYPSGVRITSFSRETSE